MNNSATAILTLFQKQYLQLFFSAKKNRLNAEPLSFYFTHFWGVCGILKPVENFSVVANWNGVNVRTFEQQNIFMRQSIVWL